MGHNSRMTKTAAKRAPAKTIGRPQIKPEEVARVRSLRLTDLDWATFHEAGGITWLRERLRRERAKVGR